MHQLALKPRLIVEKSAKRQAALLWITALIVLLLPGCRVRLIGDYDDTIDKGITDVQQKAELYFAKLQSAPGTPYDETVYEDIDSRLAVLKSRASSLEKYPIIIQQIGNLQSQFDTFQKLDKSTVRPINPVIVKDAESAISVSVESILKLELALKRGVANPPSINK